MEDKYPRIGIGVIGYNANNEILLGKRKNTHGEGDWAVPGGHLEFGETPTECAVRELKEETGLDLEDPQEIMFTNDFFDKEDKHYVTIFVQGFVEGEPKVLEVDKCEKWEWFTLESLPSPLFQPFKSFVEKLNS